MGVATDAHASRLKEQSIFRGGSVTNMGENPILCHLIARVAHLVEHRFEESGVVGSTPSSSTKQWRKYA